MVLRRARTAASSGERRPGTIVLSSHSAHQRHDVKRSTTTDIYISSMIDDAFFFDDGRTYGFLHLFARFRQFDAFLFHLLLGDSRDCFSHVRGDKFLLVALLRLLLLLRRRRRRRCFRRDHRLLLSLADETRRRRSVSVRPPLGALAALDLLPGDDTIDDGFCIRRPSCRPHDETRGGRRGHVFLCVVFRKGQYYTTRRRRTEVKRCFWIEDCAVGRIEKWRHEL